MGQQKDNSGNSISFSELVLGFSSAALLYMGESSGSQQGEKEINRPLAKYNIDIIELLQNKTANNLNEDESTLIKEILTDLRLKYSKLEN